MPIKGDEIVTSFKGDTKDVDRAFQRVEQRTQEHVRKMNSSLNGIGSGSASGSGGLLGTIKQGLELLPGIGVLASGFSKLTSAISSGIGIGFDYNRMLQENRISFEKLLGSADKAEEHIKSLSTLRKDGIGLEEALLGSKRLQAMGVSAKDVPMYLRGIGDASRAMGADIDAVTRALTQMIAKGKVSAEEITQQLAEQGIPAWKYLADAVAAVDKNFAKLTSEQQIAKVQKLAELGKLSGRGGAKAILAGMQKDFGGVGARYAEETASGLEAQVEGATKKLAGIASSPAFQKYQQGLKLALTALRSEAALGAAESAAKTQDAIFGAVESAVDGIQNVVPKAKEAATNVADAIINAVEERFQGHAPSKVMSDIGIGAGMSLVKGFNFATQGLQQGRKPYDPQRITDLVGASQDPSNDDLDNRGRHRRNKPSRRISNPVGFPGWLEQLIQEASIASGVPADLLRAMITQESGGKVGAVSHKGARGLMQLMPATARAMGVTDITDPRQNMMGGAKYMRRLLDMFGGNVPLALAGYNAGEGAVQKYGGIPPYKETQNYVRSIMARFGGTGPLPVRVVGSDPVGDISLYGRNEIDLSVQRGYPYISDPALGGTPQTVASGGGFAIPGTRRQIAGGGLGGPSGIFSTYSPSFAAGQFDDIQASVELLSTEIGDLASVIIPRAADGTLEWGRALEQAGNAGKEAVGGMAVTYEELFGKQRTLREQLEDFAGTLPETRKEFEGIFLGLPEGIGSIFGNAAREWDLTFKGLFRSIGQGFASMLADMSAQLLQSSITKLLVKFGLSALTGGLGGGGYTGLSDYFAETPIPFFGGARASGGPVSSSMAYLVGENGPEIFKPNTGGQVYNQDQMGGNTYNINVTVQEKRGGSYRQRKSKRELGESIVNAYRWQVA